MPKKATFEVGALNITTHPHTPENYQRLFLKAFPTLSRPSKVRGDTYGAVFTAQPVQQGSPTAWIEGSLIQFTQIDPDASWFDTAAKQEASPDVIQRVEEAIDGLAPNARFTRYIFDPKTHTLLWISKAPKSSFQPTAVWKVFSDALSTRQIVQEFGEVGVIIRQSREGLESIFEMPRLDKLSIHYRRPNPDDDDDDEAERAVEERLRKQKVITVDQTLTGDRHEGLQPNKNTKALARVALSNGHVEGVGVDDSGKKLTKNTLEHPWRHTEKLDPSKTDKSAWLRAQFANLLKKL